MARLEPMFARVLLERERPQQVGKIIIPDTAKIRNAPCKGRVIAVGPNADPSIKVGEWYIFGQHSGAWVNTEGRPAATVDDEKYFVCQDEDLIARVV